MTLKHKSHSDGRAGLFHRPNQPVWQHCLQTLFCILVFGQGPSNVVHTSLQCRFLELEHLVLQPCLYCKNHLIVHRTIRMCQKRLLEEVHNAPIRLRWHVECWLIALRGYTSISFAKLVECDGMCCHDLVVAVLEEGNCLFHLRRQHKVPKSVLSPLFFDCIPPFFGDLIPVIQRSHTAI
ncbi:uncharacterized protein M421DRAFT_136688 [Didymella exigua CBS 183.55]|uniref:Uncharacterized protein n=1 Tax=Didymella exigua CBS 183.55 TaxID=1150837 RepID=A0A6A5RQ85_9PLEO|nr:uncharacterized protein M421DRAFT_136688 [Didymella exigua CBS 183.55]KAF1929328.1 hypothetical protein M421DRAFT_136688 [Didymella exigua CBS 183.55]